MIRSIILWLFLTICAGLDQIHANEEQPLLKISNGWIQGVRKKSYNGREFSSFEGIPYAAPPLGPWRFEPPQEVENWTGVWIADTQTKCLQPYSGAVLGKAGEEDCLHVNVYVPRSKPNPLDNLNVLVHIHGGAWMLGSGAFYAYADYLMDEEMILVTLNYRLGSFGFLSTEDQIQPGNNGMKDQVAALKWIQKNIKYFGGNPDSITISGMSAGGASVHFHFLLPMSKGLFHRGISQSGTALNPWALQDGPLNRAKRLASLVGCPTTDSKVIVDCLRGRNANKINEATKDFLPYGGFPFSPFGPVVEVPHEGAFLSEHPYEMLVEGKVADLPWVTSVTENEGIYPAAFFAKDLDRVDRDFDKIAPLVLDYNSTVDEVEKDLISDKIKKFYFKESVNLEDFIEMCGDRHFKADAEIATKLHVKAVKSPAYFYVLAYRGQHSFSELFLESIENIGVSHADDVIHYLNPKFICEGKLSKSDEDIKNLYLEWIRNFANENRPRIEGVTWTPLRVGEKIDVLYIKGADDIEMRSYEELGFSGFWRRLNLKENANLNRIKDEL